MIKFYCKDCGKEIWQNVNLDNIDHLTLKQVRNSLVCSACVEKRIESNVQTAIKHIKERG